jgi:hypothetical protein
MNVITQALVRHTRMLPIAVPDKLLSVHCFSSSHFTKVAICTVDHLCGLVVRVLGYRSGGPGSIPGTTRKKNSGSGTGCTQPREYN